MTARILVACEFSGVVRRAFRAIGFDAWSCDLLPAEDGDRHHIQGPVQNHLEDGWHGLIAHPPCTDLAVSGARWFKGKEREQAAAIRFAEDLWFAPIPRIGLENPISVLSTRSMLGKSTQIIQPWMFGHGETKATCLWLKRLPALIPTDIVSGREARVHKMPPGPNRWKERSRTLPGIADAMASQWAESFIEQSRRIT